MAMIPVLSPEGEPYTMDEREFPEWEGEGWTVDRPAPAGEKVLGGGLRRSLDALGWSSMQPTLTGLAGAIIDPKSDPRRRADDTFWDRYYRFKNQQRLDQLAMEKEAGSDFIPLGTKRFVGNLLPQVAMAAMGVPGVAAVTGQGMAEWGAEAPTGDIVPVNPETGKREFSPRNLAGATAMTAAGGLVGMGGYKLGEKVVSPAMRWVAGKAGGAAQRVAEGEWQKGLAVGEKAKASALGSYRESLAEEVRALERLGLDMQRAQAGALPGEVEMAVRAAGRSNAVQQAAARSAMANITQMPSKLSRPAIERAAYQAVSPTQIAGEYAGQTLAPGAALRGLGRAAWRWGVGPAAGYEVGRRISEGTENTPLAIGGGVGVGSMIMRPGMRRAAKGLLLSPAMRFYVAKLTQGALSRDPSMVGRMVGTVAQQALRPQTNQEAAKADYVLGQTEPAYRQEKEEQQLHWYREGK